MRGFGTHKSFCSFYVHATHLESIMCEIFFANSLIPRERKGRGIKPTAIIGNNADSTERLLSK